MKALLIAENWPPRVGGIENYLGNIVEHLEGEVEVVAPAYATSGESEATPEESLAVSVFRKRFFWPVVRPGWLLLFIWLYRRAKKEEYDVVLCGKGLFEGLVGYYLKKYLGIPYIVFTYAMEIEVWVENPRDLKKLTRVLKSASKVAYINEHTKKRVKELGVTEEQLLELLPGIDEKYLTEVPEEKVTEVLKRFKIYGPYVLTVARLIERKGIDTLLEAFSQLDQTRFAKVELVIVGDGPEREALEGAAEKLWINTAVNFVGEVSDDDVQALYAKAKIFALTPRVAGGDFEGFGIVYLEAAAKGVPVVATRSGGVSGAVLDKETGLVVNPDSPEETKEALERLLEDEALGNRLAGAARERVKLEFTWKSRIKPLQEAIDHVTRG